MQAGAQRAGYTHLRLPYGVAPLFEPWLEEHVPTKKDKVLNRVRAMRSGQLNESQFGKRMRGGEIFAEQIASLFKLACRQARLANTAPALSTDAFRRPSGAGGAVGKNDLARFRVARQPSDFFTQNACGGASCTLIPLSKAQSCTAAVTPGQLESR
ncbi:MAG: hypothetical protein ETSY2_21945 [Candidatus Entotheonella gemina]|uniref:Uncharacterized protein n=1 Tax=Candidatus Entotheonella gemina TaxID=1429439 RepID=W4M7J8_9BACT|nr:MAG: hypothetical protein ETSY2_21945 [Candidatus Entotheonella gemina]